MAERSKGERVTSIFLGGGTPSLMEPATVAATLETVASAWTVEGGAEMTLEANPSPVEATRFHGYRAAGVNRVSLGVQALNDPDLKRLGRLHDVEQALGAIRLAREIFPRLSFDLIYARPGQTVEAWEDELGQAIDLAADHLSLYQLPIEEGTIFHALPKAGKLGHRRARAPGIRDLQPRGARRRVAAQSHILALRPLRRHRAWRARAPDGPRRTACRLERTAPGNLAKDGRGLGIGCPGGRGADRGRAGRRTAPHGASARRGDRPEALAQAHRS